LNDLAARKAKANADFQEQLKQIDDQRMDAISLTDYQKKELADVSDRETVLIKQFDDDASKLKQTLADLRSQREQLVAADSKWNAEEVRLDNQYKEAMAKYENAKASYETARDEYDHANIVKRQFLHEPVDPGVPPVREANTILKPTGLDDLDTQIKAKEAELAAVDTQRRQRVAQVEDEAKHLRDEFDTRSGDRRGDSDRKRDALLAAQAAATAKFAAEETEIDNGFDTIAQTADGIRAQIDACRKDAESCYEARVTAIENTQVHRIATTVEIIRGLLTGKHPVSITLTPKERGDLYTDQISMVRIWVYPVLAFIVAFLPTLMVEIGFSTLFKPEQTRKAYRLGFFGQHLHTLYKRAGRVKILHAERLIQQAHAEANSRNRELATAKAEAQKALAEKDAELLAARKATEAATAAGLEKLRLKEEEHAQQIKVQADEWAAKMAGMATALNRSILEKDELRDLQKSEVERQIQLRQNAWSDRLTQLRQELDAQRAAAETERTTLMQEHQRKILELTENSKVQVIEARRQAAAAELAATEATTKANHDLKQAISARDRAEEQLQQQAESFKLQLTQAKEEAAHELDKALRREKHRVELQQLEFNKALQKREEDFEHKLQQREQELRLAFEARLAQEQEKLEETAHRSQAEIERQLEARAQEVDARWRQEIQQREEAAQTRLRQREHQLQLQADARVAEAQSAAQQEMNRREADWKHHTDAQVREVDSRWNLEIQQKELAYQTKLKQREQEIATQLATQAEARMSNAHAQWLAEAEKKIQATLEPMKAMLLRVEKERDEALQTASDSVRHVQQLEKKLSDASTFLSGWTGNGHSNGKTLIPIVTS